MNRPHVTLKVHSLNGLEGAQVTGKALLASMGSLMRLEMTHVPTDFRATNITLTDNTFTMDHLHVSSKLKLVTKHFVTNWALDTHPRRGIRLGNRGAGGRGRGSGS